MTAPSQSSLAPRMQPLSRAAAVMALLVGALALAGWAFDIVPLKSVLPGLVTMKANTALAFVLAGASLWLVQDGDSSLRRRLAHVFAAGAALIGLLTLLEYLTGADLGIDQILIADTPQAAQTSAPGRMSPVTALSFALIGCALMLLDTKTRTGWSPSQFCTLPVFALALLSLLGYAYDVRSLYAVGPFTSIALHTAATLAVLCVGVLAVRPDRGLMALLTSASPGGFTARRLLPAALLLPVVLGWLRLKGERAGLYGAEFGVALFVMVCIVGLVALMWTTAQSLDRSELQRRTAEAARARLYEHLQDSHEQLRALAKRLLEVQEEERRLLARELHDEIGQQMTAIKLNLQSLQASPDPARAAARFQDSIGIVDHLLEVVRARSLNLRPPLLDELGLGPALESFARIQAQRAELVVDLAIEPNVPRLTTALEIAAFRIVQESLTNVIRHAQAARVAIAMRRTPEGLALTVHDDGRGFDIHAMREQANTGWHTGLPGLRERVKLFGGSFVVESAPGRGTEVRVTLPLEPAP